MLTMDQIHSIREMFYHQGKSISEIASETGRNRKTVTKYIDMEDFSPVAPKPPYGEEHESKLDPYKPLIDEWLMADKKAPRKQRHTASKIHKRLGKEAEGYDCSYRLTAAYVKKRKAELGLKKNENYIPLIHPAGTAQADFGYADFIENGKYHKEGKYLVLSFPHSNSGYLQLNYGENLECLLEGLQAMFEYIGGAPTEIWFDNTRTIVTDIIQGGGRNVTERFQQFCEHYRFKPVFMNPYSGNEKGNVENKVGYLRRNALVPVPEFDTLAKFNKELLSLCDKDIEREHYDDDDGRYISEIFKEDKAALIPLPSVRFDTSKYARANTDKYGRFTLDGGKHRYSASPAFCADTVNLRITSSEVTVMDKDMHEVITHKRLYGDEKESMDWLPYLKYIAKKPRSLRNSGIYDMMPESMQMYMDSCKSSDRGRILKVLSDLTESTGFDSAIQTVNEAIRCQANDPDSLQCLYNRMYSDVPVLPPLTDDPNLPDNVIVPFRNDLKVLDAALVKGGAANA